MKEQIEKLTHYSVSDYREWKTRRGVGYEGDLKCDGILIGGFSNDGDGSATDIYVEDVSQVKTFIALADEIFAGYSIDKTAHLIDILIDAYQRAAQGMPKTNLLAGLISFYQCTYAEFKAA